MFEDEFDEEDGYAAPSSMRQSVGAAPAPRPAGALAAFDPEFMRSLFPQPPKSDIPDLPNPVDPGAKWRAFAAGVLEGGPRFSGSLASGLKAMGAQETKDAELMSRYVPQALRLKQQRQMEEMRRAQMQQQQMQGWTQNLLGSVAPLVGSGAPLNPAQIQAAVGSAVQMGRVPPQLAERFLATLPQDPEAMQAHLANMMRAQADPFAAFRPPQVRSIGPNSTLLSVSPDGRSASVLHENKTERDNAFIQMLRQAGIDPASPQGQEIIRRRLQKETTHAPGTQVNMRQEGAEAKAVGEGFGKMFNDLQRDALNAQGKLGSVRRMEQLLEGVSTGKLTPLITDIQGYAAELGIKLSDKLGQKEAIEALTNEMALQARDPSGGAGMPGAMSDQDRQFLVRITPGLSKSPEGNRLILETHRRLHRRSIDVARLANQYRMRNGQMDSGFLVELEQWSAANPLFADLQQRMGGGAPRGGAQPDAKALLERARQLREGAK